MANSRKFLLCSLALAACMLNGLLAYEISVEEEWGQLKSRIFNRLASSLPIKTTLETLQRMDEIYPLLKGEKGYGTILGAQYKYVNDLLKLSQLNESRCDPDTFEDFNDALRVYMRHRKIIIPYVHSYHNRLFKLCWPKFEKQLKEAISVLSEQQREDVQLLTKESLDSDESEKLAKTPAKLKLLALTNLENASLQYLRYQADNKFAKTLRRSDSRKEFEELYEDSVALPCRIIRKELQAPLQFYDRILSDQKLAKQLSFFEVRWITVSKVCHAVALQTEETLEALFYRLPSDQLDLDRLPLDNWICYACKF